MKIKYIGKERMDFLVPNNRMDLTPNKVYEVIKEGEWSYTLIDNSGEDYSYPKSMFEIVEK